jgi:hypothetical protein
VIVQGAPFSASCSVLLGSRGLVHDPHRFGRCASVEAQAGLARLRDWDPRRNQLGKYGEARTRRSPWFFIPPTTEGRFSAAPFTEAKAALRRQCRR